ncbi:hypothetical protein PENTCL1PPCAC_24346 [Pristionchus entomophagus]|uniref:Alpha-type protein kinase domain-containing protein n=1 Tax=Pristionchus entomophagus TaxID=358040 RepID=A0AAV5U706_9BILA|nr:hypothetical protein PENTCL1PPCAC_24346 [Pristionchus entomophagus]
MASEASFENETATNEQSHWLRQKESQRKSAASDRKRSEINKRMKVIFEDEGLDYGADTKDDDELLDRFKVATRLRAKNIEEVRRNIKRAENVQLCFLVDVTGSMQSHIDGVRKSIDEMLNELTDNGRHVTFKGEGARVAQSMELAFVAYRDHGDTKQFEVLPFTDAAAFKAFTRDLEARGGGSDAYGCEDVFGGLDAALNLDWSESCGTKVMFHICDQPCHGSEFHAGRPDSHPNGDPKGRTCKGLFAKLRETGIQYHFGKITSDTDIMIRKFSEAYGEPITEFDVKNVQKLGSSVVAAVSKSVIARVASASRRAGGVERKERSYTFEEKEPDWSSLPAMNGKLVSYDFPRSIQDIEDDEPLVRRQPKSATIKLAKHPFAKGAERAAYYGKDISTYTAKSGSTHSSNENIVVKEIALMGKGMESARRYEINNQMQTVASFLALKFMEDLKRRAGIDKTIQFLKIRTLSLDQGSSKRYLSCEKRYSAGTKFVRFSNNAGYLISEKHAAELGISAEFLHLVFAFSHWTYKASNRFLMVVDLEGVVGRIEGDDTTGVHLTDPAIHSKDRTRFGIMNHGVDGMKKFFETHSCNEFCKALGLESFVC